MWDPILWKALIWAVLFHSFKTNNPAPEAANLATMYLGIALGNAREQA